MRRYTLRAAALLLISAIAFSLQAQVQEAAELGAMLTVLQQLRQTLDGVVNTVDAESAARIRQIELALDGTIAKLDNVIKNGFDRANTTREALFSDINNTLSQVNNEVQAKGYWAYIGVNSTLANAARIANGIPFFHVRAFAFATTPLRMQRDSADRLVSFYGYFPDVDAKHPARIRVGTQTFTAKLFADGSLAAEVPSQLLPPEEQFLSIALLVPVRHHFGFRSTEEFSGRVYIEKKTPYTFAVTVYTDNPASHAIIGGQSHLERADSGRTTNDQTVSAPQLFSVTVNDNVHYDMSTAKFANMTYTKADGERPCDCCDSSTAQLVRWDADVVQWHLYAPTCGDHWCNIRYHCGGGGTNASITLMPTFRVKVRNVPDEVVSQQQSLTAQRAALTAPVSVGPWTSIEVKGVFQDGREHYENEVRLTPGVAVGNLPLWVASVNGANLVIQTR